MAETATPLSSQLERLLELEPALKNSLSEAKDTEQIVTLLSEAAARHGQALDSAALRQALDAARQIGQLVEADPELAQALKEADSARQAAELIQRAARRRNVQIGQSAPGARELDDAELEHAVGGLLIEGAIVGLTIFGIATGVGLGATSTVMILGLMKKL